MIKFKHRWNYVEIISIVYLVTVLAVSSCVNKQAPVEIQPELKKLELLHRVQELQRTVIAIHDAAPEKLNKINADIIVKFTLAANDLIAASEIGWQGKVKSLWLNLKSMYEPPANLFPIWSIVDALMQGLL